MNSNRFKANPSVKIQDPKRLERIKRIYGETKRILTENRFNFKHFLEYCKKESAILEKSEDETSLSEEQKKLYHTYKNIDKIILEEFIKSNNYTNRYERILLAFAEFHKHIQNKKRYLESIQNQQDKNIN